jgi:predicted DNA-binding transcriptional regulator YafY
LQALNEEDRYHINQALDRGANTRLANQLKSKIEGLYDFQQLGLRQLRHPAIERINRLEGAIERQQKVVLVRYRSNSNKIKSRTVEPFLVNPELDTLQAFDYDRMEARHFRLSRIERVELLEESWEYQPRHLSRATDVFRIASNDQVMVKLRLTVQAYNYLMENYPMAAAYTEPGSEENEFLFQAKVNADFLGLSTFVMGHTADVEILGPAALKQHTIEKAQEILTKYRG